MKYLIFFFLFTFINILLLQTSLAQFIGIGADIPISYSQSSKKPQGGFIQITHTTPSLPNFNVGFFTIGQDFKSSEENAHTLRVSGTMSLIEFFYHIPIPFFSFGLGLGGGNFFTNTEIIQNAKVLQKADQSGYVGAGFMQIGLPLWNTIEVHGSYHRIIAKDYKLIKKEDIKLIGVKSTQDFSGTLLAVGFQIAF